MLAIGNGEILYAFACVLFAAFLVVVALILAWLLITGQGATWSAKITGVWTMAKSTAVALYDWAKSKLGKGASK